MLIEGARRVGKSTAVEEFAKNEYATYILIDFSTASNNIRELFDDMSDLNYFFLRLQLQYHVELVVRNSVIIFDEVQLCPKARQAIKTLVKDGRYDYIETGSLISIKKNVKDILIPSEERKIQMHPMDYEEFLWALNDTSTMNLLKGIFDTKKTFGDQINRKLMRDFRLYMLVGGMPQAVNEYITTNNFKKVDELSQQTIILCKNNISTFDELTVHKNELSNQLKSLEIKQHKYRNDTRKCNDADKKDELKLKARELTPIIVKLRKEIAYCQKIEERSLTISKFIDDKERKDRSRERN